MKKQKDFQQRKDIVHGQKQGGVRDQGMWGESTSSVLLEQEGRGQQEGGSRTGDRRRWSKESRFFLIMAYLMSSLGMLNFPERDIPSTCSFQEQFPGATRVCRNEMRRGWTRAVTANELGRYFGELMEPDILLHVEKEGCGRGKPQGCLQKPGGWWNHLARWK